MFGRFATSHEASEAAGYIFNSLFAKDKNANFLRTRFPGKGKVKLGVTGFPIPQTNYFLVTQIHATIEDIGFDNILTSMFDDHRSEPNVEAKATQTNGVRVESSVPNNSVGNVDFDTQIIPTKNSIKTDLFLTEESIPMFGIQPEIPVTKLPKTDQKKRCFSTLV